MHRLISIGSLSSTSYQYKKHSHRYWEITYYYGGTGINITDNTEYPFTPGTIVCQPPLIDHEDHSEGGYTNIYFMVESFNFVSSSPIVFHDNNSQDFLCILRQLHKEFYANKLTKSNIINALLNVLYEYMIDLIGTKSQNAYVDSIQQLLIRNLSNSSFSVAEALATIPMNEDYFRRQFKSSLGMPPAEYLQSIRISYAKQMLVNSSLPLKDICQMCGYDDPYYFSRIFKKHAGVAPSEWRLRNAPIA